MKKHGKNRCAAAPRLGALALVLAMLFSFGGCGPTLHRYEVSYLSLFDTVVTILLYAENEAAAQAEFKAIYNDLARYDALFDIYEDHPGVNNLKTVNDNGGIAPVAVAPELMALLSFGKEVYTLTDGRVNMAFGSVLSIWHEARIEGTEHPEAAALPDMAALQAAAEHCNIDNVVLDEAAGTVYLADPMLRLDVGAVAKGFAAQLVCDSARARGVTSMLLNLGGNVCAIGAKGDGSPWRVEIQDPDDAAKNLGAVDIGDASLVTSGGYQRYYTVDGIKYHHIIDPDTLMPAAYIKAVTVSHVDSAMADAFSTALFNLPYEEGRALAQRNGVSALWELLDGTIYTLDMEAAK